MPARTSVGVRFGRRGAFRRAGSPCLPCRALKCPGFSPPPIMEKWQVAPAGPPACFTPILPLPPRPCPPSPGPHPRFLGVAHLRDVAAQHARVAGLLAPTASKVGVLGRWPGGQRRPCMAALYATARAACHRHATVHSAAVQHGGGGGAAVRAGRGPVAGGRTPGDPAAGTAGTSRHGQGTRPRVARGLGAGALHGHVIRPGGGSAAPHSSHFQHSPVPAADRAVAVPGLLGVWTPVPPAHRRRAGAGPATGVPGGAD